MRKLIVDIEASHIEQEIEWYEKTPLDPDSLYDYWIHEIVTQPNYTWKVVDEEGNDVTSEYKYE